jgi:hypothetical protein
LIGRLAKKGKKKLLISEKDTQTLRAIFHC